MKKYIVCLVALVFVAAVASATFGRTVENEKLAINNYITVLDKRIAKAHKAGQNALENRLFAIKQAQLARLDALNPKKVVVTTPAPVAQVIEVPAVAAIVPSRGVAVYVNGGVDAGLVGFAANLDYAILGGFNEGIKLRVGANYLAGNNPNGNDLVKVASAKLGACYYLTPHLPTNGMPIAWYVGGAYLWPFKVYGDRTGKWGVEAYLGADYSIPEMGIVNFEIGYSGLKYAADQPALKGIDLKVGYGLAF